MKVIGKNQHVAVDISVIENPRMTFMALGLYVYLLAKPDQFEINLEDLCYEYNINEDIVRDALEVIQGINGSMFSITIA